MIPIDAASLTPKLMPGIVALKISAPRKVKNTPNYAAAPRRILFGFAISGPKSVIHPIPTKISGG